MNAIVQKGGVYAHSHHLHRPWAVGSVLVAQGLTHNVAAWTASKVGLVLLTLLCCPPVAIGSGHCFSANGNGWTLYSYADPELSCRDYIRSKQDLVRWQNPSAALAKLAFGAIVTEPDYLYIAFNLTIPDNLTLCIPKGEGTLVLETLDGLVPDQGVFFQRHNGQTRITTIASTDEWLFVNTANSMLNSREEPRIIARFPKQTKLDRIVGLVVSERVITIDAK